MDLKGKQKVVISVCKSWASEHIPLQEVLYPDNTVTEQDEIRLDQQTVEQHVVNTCNFHQDMKHINCTPKKKLKEVVRTILYSDINYLKESMDDCCTNVSGAVNDVPNELYLPLPPPAFMDSHQSFSSGYLTPLLSDNNKQGGWTSKKGITPANSLTNERNFNMRSNISSAVCLQSSTNQRPYGACCKKKFSDLSDHSSGFSPEADNWAFRRDWKQNFKLFHNFDVDYVDTHCHLDFLFNREVFTGSFRTYMQKHPETFPAAFSGCVAVFCNPTTFTPQGGLWLDVAREDNVWIALGCHPKMALDFTSSAEQGLKACLCHEKVVALGEIGLDYSGKFYQHKEIQKQVFYRQLEIALEMRKPLVIHCRDAEEDCLSILKKIIPQDYKIHCHCFTYSYNNAKLWLDAFPNLFIGVTPLVTYQSATPLHDLAQQIPLNRLLLETDAPYFVPSSIPRKDLPLSNPGLAVTVAKEIAKYQNVPVADVLRHCRHNTKMMYGI